MLRNLDPVLSADLLWVLAAMGHGDDLALVDANHPAETIARATTSGRLVRLPGLTMARAARAILSVLPIDDFEPEPVRRMLVVGDPAAIPDVQAQVQAELDRANEKPMPLVGIDRFAFYEAAKSAFAVVQVGDPRPYGCFLLRKGVIAGPPG
ncbi:RbsD/FucU domain-containing protein [Bosea sp. (in: a-proteobacteria)]|jgi:L-fucose mutarotase|uniref:RbsD/FucU family protein n=1 Tax=Bosea sp. (in: a-proteobacteria) TaxID=1871050 RepID=UPI001ACF553D|nr:RbsD/FucU domain-containing protein [Bosea sp. (in: a-proteobacteria)]MBN9440075.1 fucose-binding protein [Bosea sp. (in: a-proteobacteria)]MBN9447165.1 fucose-binding protein [Bosea sp. (in: a-proteobacteria)]